MDAPAPTQGCANCVRLQAQVEQLQALVAQLQQQVRELQARLDQDSSNSHKPPSSDPPWAGPRPTAKRPSGRRPGGQVGHEGHHRRRLPPGRVDHYVHHLPTRCRHCRAALPRDASPDDPEPSWHQVAELPTMAAVVTEHRGHARTCRRCGTVTRAAIPAGVRRHAVGPRLAAAMSYLAGRCHDGRRTVREVVQDLFDVPLSLGAVGAYERQTCAALARPCGRVVRHVRSAPVKHVDETGWKRAGRRCWLWTCATARAAAFAVQPVRNWQGLCRLLGRRGGRGVVCSDRWHAYSRLGRRRRQVCWAHLRRDFQKWADRGGATRQLGEDGLELCKQVFALWRDFRQRRRLTRRQLQRRLGPVRRRLRQVLTWALRCGHRPATTFCRNLLSVGPALWTFARVEGLEPTNNAAERALRPAVLWRKNSFGCHSEQGCRFAERMLTAVQTLRLQHRPVLAWLGHLLHAHRTGSPGPELC